MTTKLQYFRDGDVVLYKRDESTFWQARYKLADLKWHRISTKCRNIQDASKVACDAHDEAKFFLKHNIPQITKRFADVAKLAIEEMEAHLKAGTGKTVYSTYIAAIKLHLIPYFGKKHIDKIGMKDFADFNKQYEAKTGKPLKASTATNHNTAIYRIFDIALSKGWVNKINVPQLKNKGEASNRRPAFSLHEWNVIRRRLRDWCKIGHTEKTRQMRMLMRDYVLILGNTGMRHGTEAANLKWKHVYWHDDKNDGRFLMMAVDGKTGRRDIVCRHNVLPYLKRIQSRFPDLAKYSFDDLIKAKIDLPVFRLESGVVTASLNQSFKQFLISASLLKDKYDDDRTLYSLRHMYATLSLIYGKIDIHGLAKQMGTSVGMIEQHYSHLQPAMLAVRLAGKRMTEKPVADVIQKNTID